MIACVVLALVGMAAFLMGVGVTVTNPRSLLGIALLCGGALSLLAVFEMVLIQTGVSWWKFPVLVGGVVSLMGFFMAGIALGTWLGIISRRSRTS